MGDIYEVALVFSAHEWVEAVHRHATNTGSIRIKSLVYDPAALSEGDFEVCVISDSHPNLTKKLVESIHKNQRYIFGVCDDSSSAREYLTNLGVDAVISSRKKAEDISSEIITLLNDLNNKNSANDPIETQFNKSEELPSMRMGNSKQKIITFTRSGGAGTTEIANAIVSRLIDSIIVDFDLEHPSLGPRLGLQLEPNLITALEHCINNDEFSPIPAQRSNRFSVISGTSHSSFSKDIKPFETLELLETLKDQYTNIIFDIGRTSNTSIFWDTQKTILQNSDQIFVVTGPTPVDILRTLEIIADINLAFAATDRKPEVKVIINKTHKNKFIENQIREELDEIAQISRTYFLPYEKLIINASWRATITIPKNWKKTLSRILVELETISDKHLQEDQIKLQEDYLDSTRQKVLQ